MSKRVKIVLLAPGAAEAALEIGTDKKTFIETLVEERDEKVPTSPGLFTFFNGAGAFPRFAGIPSHPGIPITISPPGTTSVTPEEAVKRAVERKLKEYNLNIDKSRLIIHTLSDTTPEVNRSAFDGGFLHVVLYKLSDSEKAVIERRHLYSPFLPMISFFPLAGLPLGLPLVDAGVARFLTSRYDIIRDSVYLGDPRVLFPSNILPYNPLYPVPLYSPYLASPIVKYGSSYVNPNQIFEPTRGRQSRSRSSSRSSSRSPSRSRGSNKSKRDKYLKYKQKYLDLKAQIDKL